MTDTENPFAQFGLRTKPADKEVNPFAQFDPRTPTRSLDDEPNPFAQFDPRPPIQSNVIPQKNNGFWRETGHQVGLTGHAVARTAADMAGLIGDPLNATINKIAGTHLPAVSQSTQALIDKFFPQPQNAAERVVQDAASMMASVGTGGTLARGLSALFKTAGHPQTQAVLQQLGRLNKTDLASAAAGGSGAGLARENEAGIGGQLLGGLLGAGALPAAQATYALPKTILAKLAQAVPSETVKLGRRATELGIPLRAAQLSQSRPLQVMDSVLSKLPFSGAGEIQQKQQQAFNRAVSRTFGEDAPLINKEVMNAAREHLGREFDRLSRQNTLQVDSQLLADLAETESRARFLEPGQAQVIRNHIDDILDKSSQNWMAGEAYQNKRSYLNRQKNASEGVFKDDLRKLRNVLDTAFNRSIAPQDVAALGKARAEYQNMKTIENLAEKAIDGDVSPALLLGEVRKTHSDNLAYKGAGEIGDLARIGQRFLKEKVQNSGTPERAAMLGMLSGGLAGIPANVAGLLTGRMIGSALNSPKLAQHILVEAVRKGVGLPTTATGMNPLTWTLTPYLATTQQQPKH